MVLTTGWPVRLIPAWAGKTSATWFLRLRSPAHPRMGGENAEPDGLVDPDAGSSPRGRGKQGHCLHEVVVGGLIPARAGKTIAVSASVAVAGAHPRAGGENPSSPMTPGAMPGSSPRGREKRSLIERLLQLRRLIPARAGKTKIAVSSPFNHEAHPRAGGENDDLEARKPGVYGSSPRGRGKQRPPANYLTAGGLIPARAGKTGMSVSRKNTARAHPRAGGENVRVRRSILSTQGSSPRGRGKRGPDHRIICQRGLIPARAGKTRDHGTRHDQRAAHPRAGGENLAEQGWDVPALGSSPRGRGKLSGAGLGCPGPGLIPARAGKTLDCVDPRLTSSAHPRAGGENPHQGYVEVYAQGSSPRGRGKRTSVLGTSLLSGLIPARAGKTTP